MPGTPSLEQSQIVLRYSPDQPHRRGVSMPQADPGEETPAPTS